MAKDMISSAEVAEILANHWPGTAGLSSVGAPERLVKTDGFSRSQIWRVPAPQQAFCLRGVLQEDVPRERLAWLQVLLQYAKQHSPNLPLPLPISARDGSGIVAAQGQFWELTPWFSGWPALASAANANDVKVAFQATAHLHLAFAEWAKADGTFDLQKSPGAQLRHDRLAQLKAGGIFDLAALMGAAQKRGLDASLLQACEAILSHFWTLQDRLLMRLEVARNLTVPIQPAVRDLRAEHFLFASSENGQGSTLSGILDFGATRLDSVMLDLSRLLTTLHPNSAELQKVGLDAYREVRPLSPPEEDLLPALVESAPLHNGLQWLIWLFQERMSFEDGRAVVRRMQQIATALQIQAQMPTGGLQISPGGILF